MAGRGRYFFVAGELHFIIEAKDGRRRRDESEADLNLSGE
jgi:hypothetical protein